MTENIVGKDISSVLTSKRHSSLFSRDLAKKHYNFGFRLFFAQLLGWFITKPLLAVSWVLNLVISIQKMVLVLRTDTLQLFYWGRGSAFAIFTQAIGLFIILIIGFSLVVGNIGEEIANEYGITSIEHVAASASNDIATESGSLTTALPKELKRLDTVEYTVTYSDTLEENILESLAADWDVSADSIRWANNYNKTFQPKVGTVVKIPPISGSYYTVQKDENLEIISSRFKIDQATLAEVNFLPEPYKLTAGQQILLPGIAPQLPVVAKKIKNTKKSTGFNNYGGSNGSYTPPTGPTFLDWPVIGGNGGQISRCYSVHDGIDVNPLGTGSSNPTVVAAAPGRVTYAGVHCTPGMPYKTVCGGFAWVVEIDHGNGFSTVYGHLQSNTIMVRAGDAVQRKQPIGKMGATGTVFGNPGTHLHFQLNHGGFLGKSGLRPVNPAPYLFNRHGC